MTDYKASDIHFPLSAVNAGLLAASALEGDAGMMAFNGGLLALNGSLAIGGRKDEIEEGLSKAPEKTLGEVYDLVLKDDMVRRINDLETDPGSRTSGRRIC